MTTTGSVTAGQKYTLECNVSIITGLTDTPTVTWLHPNGTESGDSFTISPDTPPSSSTLTFTPLTISHAGQYTCEGSIESPALDSPLTVRETQNVTVQCNIFAYEIYSVHFILKDVDLSSVTVDSSLMICYLIVMLSHSVPSPTAVTVTASPDGPFIVDGHPLSLTGTIKLSEAVNIAVTVNTVWSGPSGTQFTTTTSVASMVTATTYTSTATISSVETSDSGEYTCTATVSSTSPFLTDSENIQGIISTAVGMLQLCFKYSPLSVCSFFASLICIFCLSYSISFRLHHIIW